MPIDPARAVGAGLTRHDYAWSDRDVILYNLGVGAGAAPDDPSELAYTYEEGLRALPTFGTIPPFRMLMGFEDIDGVDISMTRVLHGEHTLVVHAPVPTSGSVVQHGTIVDIHDKGSGALVVAEVVSVLETTGEPLFTNRAGVFVRGEGGFGGEPGTGVAQPTPDRIPDLVVESPTLAQQALLYRMASGDHNPLHADPGFAAVAGYERPILHGLCTYGVVAKAVVQTALGGDTDRFGSFSARFTGHVFPGETLVTRIWDEGDHWLLDTICKERGTRVLGNAALWARDA
jgi:acyl dehydratase